jgi:hypothetical protein
VSKDRLPEESAVPGKETPVDVRKERLDLVVLQFMAKKIFATLRTLEQSGETVLPLSYAFEEQRGRQHRMIIFAPYELLGSEELHFVGFVSYRCRMVEQHVIDEIFRVDRLMLAEIARIPGILSYSSLELRPHNWYNLVLFSAAGVKLHVKSMETHRYAAYELSPAYYEWVRLHSGTMPDGLAHQKLRLNSTKYYRFSGSQRPPAMRELNYETSADP